jgi:Glucose-6-phosphate 1-dehydrogenase
MSGDATLFARSDEVEEAWLHRSYRGRWHAKKDAPELYFIPLDRGDRKLPMICSPATAARGEDYKRVMPALLKHTR